MIIRNDTIKLYFIGFLAGRLMTEARFYLTFDHSFMS